MEERETRAGPCILIVDDEASVLTMFRAVLESEGYTVTTASSAVEARKKLTAGKYDLVATDIRMETETAGFDVVRAARRRPEAPAILLLTAYPISEPQWREAGAHAGFMKGMPIEQLVELIQRLLAARAERAADRAQERRSGT